MLLSSLGSAVQHKKTLLLFLTVLVLVFRRPDQFIHPEIWVEDGRNVFPEYARWGFESLLLPVNGYYITIPRLLSLIAFKTSVFYAPGIETFLATLFTWSVVLAVALSPTHLRYKLGCAIFILVAPYNSEVFATTIYGLWWAGIPLLLAALWRTGEREWLRCIFLVLGGLSSPVIVAAAAVLACRSLIERTWASVTAAVISCAIAAIQTFSILKLGASAVPSINLPMTIGKFFGGFFGGGYASDSVMFAVALPLLVLAAVVVWDNRSKLGFPFLIMLALYALTIILSLARVSVEVLHPFLGGPRYFFYPYVLIGWSLLWIAAEASGPWRLAPVAILIVSIVLAAPNVTQRQDVLGWAKNLQACAESNDQNFELKVHFSGWDAIAWSVRMEPADCRRAIAKSLL
jgi:hypothetical protein